jgi:hypothetical protein
MLLRKDKGQTRDCTVESIVQEVRVPGGGADSDILVFQGNDPNANPNPPRLRKSTTKNKSWRNNFHGSGYEFFFVSRMSMMASEAMSCKAPSELVSILPPYLYSSAENENTKESKAL